MNVCISNLKTNYLDWKIYTEHQALIASIKTHGCLAPLLCIKKGQETYIIDGFKRFHIALLLNIKTLPISIISNDIALETLVHQLHAQELQQALWLKLRFIQCFELPIIDATCQLLNLPSYGHVKTDIQRLLALPEEIQTILQHKNFSFKELLHLIHYQVDWLKTVLSQQESLQLSKRQMDQIISGGIDLVKRHSWDLTQLKEALNWQETLSEDITPQQRSQRLLQRLQGLLHPSLSKINDDIQIQCQYIKEITNTEIHIDPSLETKSIVLKKDIHSIEEFTQFKQSLQASKLEDHLQDIMKYL